MLIANKKEALKGLLLLLSFAAMFAVIMAPVFKNDEGEPRTGLEYADGVFNALSKGSSWFIPEVREAIKPLADKRFNIAIDQADPGFESLALLILKKSGLEASVSPDGKIAIAGRLGDLLTSAVNVSELLYENNGAAVSELYDENSPATVARVWWRILAPMVKTLQKSGDLASANAVDLVVRKALEPGNNFYGIRPYKVLEHIPLITFLLTFYVLYAIWYGFGITGLFAGIGLVGKHKQSRSASSENKEPI